MEKMEKVKKQSKMEKITMLNFFVSKNNKLLKINKNIQKTIFIFFVKIYDGKNIRLAPLG